MFAVVLIGELLAFLLILTPLSVPGERWNDLGLISLFIQWVALTSIGVLCISRRWLRLLDNWAAGVVSYVMVLAVTLLLSEVAYLLLEQRLIDVKLYAAMQISEQAYWFAQQQLAESATRRRLTPRVSGAKHRYQRDCDRHRVTLFLCAVSVADQPGIRGAVADPGVAIAYSPPPFCSTA